MTQLALESNVEVGFPFFAHQTYPTMPRKEPAPKRLNKRQQRELEELEQLNALKQLEQKDVDSDEGEELEQVDADQSVDDDEEDVDVEVGSTPAAGGKVNPFDAVS